MSNAVLDKSKAFAISIVRLCQYLKTEKKEHVLSKQLLRSGTSIGANVKEALYAQSKSDFISKMNIALKEAGETEYWLDLLCEAELISLVTYEKTHSDCVELIKMLTSIVKNSKE